MDDDTNRRGRARRGEAADRRRGRAAGGIADGREAWLAMLRHASIEVSPNGCGVADELRDWLVPGAQVYVAAVPRAGCRQIVEAAAALGRAGFDPVPHIAARNIAGRAELDDFLARLTGEAGCARALLIAGDAVARKGPFASTLELLRTGLVEKHGLKAVGIAGHPEGHHTIHQFQLWNALNDKIAVAREAGLAVWIVTQFCFEAQPVVDWLKAVRRSGIDVPVRVGVAGPATVTTLLNYAVRCGVGNSLRVLIECPKRFGRLLTVHGPDELIGDLCDGLADFPSGEVGLHVFPFGGVARALRWRAEALVLPAPDADVAAAGSGSG